MSIVHHNWRFTELGTRAHLDIVLCPKCGHRVLASKIRGRNVQCGFCVRSCPSAMKKWADETFLGLKLKSSEY